jgi:hypothetical protein
VRWSEIDKDFGAREFFVGEPAPRPTGAIFLRRAGVMPSPWYAENELDYRPRAMAEA